MVRKLCKSALLISAVLVLWSGISTVPAYANGTMRDAAENLVSDYMTRFDNYAFSKSGAATMCSKDKYMNALANVDVVYDPNLKKANAEYRPGYVSKLTGENVRGQIIIKHDIVKNPNVQGMSETLWHELTHAIEDQNGDFDNPNSGDVKYDERNIEYMEQCITAMDMLRSLELGAGKNEDYETLKTRYEKFIKQFDNAKNLEVTKAYPADEALLRGWFGFSLRPDKVMEYYASGAAGENLKKFAVEYSDEKRGVGGSGSKGRFPAKDHFNGMSITYSVSGVKVDKVEDVEGFTTVRYLEGTAANSGSVTVSGTASQTWGYGADVYVCVDAGSKIDTFEKYISNPGNTSFSLTVPIESDARFVKIAIEMDGSYSMGGGHRGLDVIGHFEIPQSPKGELSTERPKVNPPDTRIYPTGLPGLDFANNYPPALYKNREIKIKIGDKRATINGHNFDLDVEPFTQNGRTYIPLRFVAESLGAQVDYIPDLQGSKTIVISGAREKHEDYLLMFIGSKSLLHNGNKTIMDVAPIIKNSRTLVPIRAIAEALNATVSWDPNTFVVTIKSN